AMTAWEAVRATRAEHRAQEQATRASAEAKLAREAQKVATEKSTVAEAQRARAEEQAGAVRLLTYVDAMNVAQRCCQEGNFAQALSLWRAHQSQEGKTDLRGLEWGYFSRLCRGSSWVTLPRHEMVLGSMEFSPDGRQLATWCWGSRKLRV